MDFKQIFTEINDMQANGVIGQYAIGGAVGAMLHKVEVDTTYDVDVFVNLQPPPGQLLVLLHPILDYLQKRGYTLNREGYVRIADWPVQFVTPTSKLTEEALQNATELNIDGVNVRVFPIEYLAAIAFQVGRSKDKLRLPRLISSDEFNQSLFSEILEKHGLLDRWVKFREQILD